MDKVIPDEYYRLERPPYPDDAVFYSSRVPTRWLTAGMAVVAIIAGKHYYREDDSVFIYYEHEYQGRILDFIHSKSQEENRGKK